MNITLDKPSATDGTIRISLQETDYLPRVEEKIREYSRKMNIKGFRQGKVPAGVVKKMFGKSILVEEVNHLLSHSVTDYIRENKLKVLGDPIPNEEKARLIDWENQKDFEFEFKVGLVADFSVDLTKKVKVNSYQIEIDQAVMDETMKDIRRRYGKVTQPETSSESDNVFGEVTDEKGDKRSSYIQISEIKKSEQKKFIGLKKDDEVSFEISTLSSDPAVLGRIINLPEEDAGKAKGQYTLKVSSISNVEDASIDQELFDKVFGKDVVKSEQEFMDKVRETIRENYERESNHLLEHEIEHHLMDHTSINMPDEFLRSYLKASGGEKITDEVIAKEFDEYKKGLKYELIMNHLAEEFKVTVDNNEVRDKAKTLIAQQFGGPAIVEQLGDKFDSIADSFLAGQDGKGQQYMRIHGQLRHEKIMKAVKEAITINEKKVTLEEFKKHAEEHKH